MYHYLQALTNPSGDSQVGFFARLIDPVTQATIPLYADNNGTPIASISSAVDMAKTDALGNLSFYVATAGIYHLDVYGTDATTFVQRYERLSFGDGGQQLREDLAEDAGAGLIGTSSGISVQEALSGVATGLKAYATRALLYADTAQPNGTLAYVFGDPTAAYNTVYQWGGASWTVAAWYFDAVVAVVGPLLTTAVLDRGVIIETSNIDNIAPGVYSLGTNANRPAGTFPSGYNAAEVGTLASMSSSTNTIQILTTTSGTTIWMRFLRVGIYVSPWIALNLSQSFYKSVLDNSVNIDTFTDEGSYIVNTTITPGTYPAGMSTYGILINQGFGNFHTQQISALQGVGAPPRIWARDKTVAFGLSAWAELTSTGGGSGLPLDGKTIVFLGDSITGGVNGTPASQYPTYVAARTGATVINFGIGGTQMANHLAVAQFSPFSFCNLATAFVTGTWTTQDANITYVNGQAAGSAAKLAAMKTLNWSDVNYLVVAYGHNDRSNGIVVGTNTSTNNDQFYGAMRNGINALLTAYPHLQIIMVTPYERGNAIGTIAPFVAAIIDVSENEFHLPYIDLFRKSSVNTVTESTLLDAGHLHPADSTMYERLGRQVGAGLNATV